MSSSPDKENIQLLIRRFRLQRHPEGGYFSEVYRSAGVIDLASPLGFPSARNFSTSIYFLLTSGNFSAFHRIRQDEIWHFYAGTSLNVHVIDPSGGYNCYTVGNQFDLGESPQLVVKGGHWFAAAVRDPGSYAFVGCTVAPGFDFQDFELARRDELTLQFPQHTSIIREFTRG